MSDHNDALEQIEEVNHSVREKPERDATKRTSYMTHRHIETREEMYARVDGAANRRSSAKLPALPRRAKLERDALAALDAEMTIAEAAAPLPEIKPEPELDDGNNELLDEVIIAKVETITVVEVAAVKKPRRSRKKVSG